MSDQARGRHRAMAVRLAATFIAVLVLTGCADDAGDAGPDVLSIVIDGDRVLPSGKRIEASVGEPFRVDIRSDRPGELHIHSAPEQTVEFEAGTTTEDLVVGTPGTVHIEEHVSGVAVARVEVK